MSQKYTDFLMYEHLECEFTTVGLFIHLFSVAHHVTLNCTGNVIHSVYLSMTDGNTSSAFSNFRRKHELAPEL